MRCSRCHSKIDGAKVRCPNCGMLIKKRRGSIKISQTAYDSSLGAAAPARPSLPFKLDFGRFFKWLKMVDPRIWIIVGAVLLAGGLTWLFIWLGVSGACSSCGSCASCGSCSSCASCESGGPWETSYNSGGSAFWKDGVLYYAGADGIHSLAADGTGEKLAQGDAISSVYADAGQLCYLRGGSLWRVPFEKPITVSESSAYSASRLIDPAAGEIKLDAVAGYAIYGETVYYWGKAGEVSHVLRRELGGGAAEQLCTGSFSYIGMYRGWLFTADSEGVLRWNVESGSCSSVFTGEVGRLCFSDGCIFVFSPGEGGGVLQRINIKSLKLEQQWQTPAISGLAANDEIIYYCVNSADGGELYSMSPDGGELRIVFTDPSSIELDGVAGDCFAVRVGAGAGKVFYIFNSVTREQLVTIRG